MVLKEDCSDAIGTDSEEYMLYSISTSPWAVYLTDYSVLNIPIHNALFEIMIQLLVSANHTHCPITNAVYCFSYILFILCANFSK